MTDPTTTEHPFARRLLAVIEADREAVAPPPGLALRTLGRVAEALVAERRFDPTTGRFREPPATVPSEVARRQPSADGPVFLSWARADTLVVAALVLLAVALGLPLVQKARTRADFVACQDQLRGLHTGLKGYADTHDGQLPKVGTPALPTAGGFVNELALAGQTDPTRPLGCGRREGDPDPGYAYTLGHRNAGGWLTGVRLNDVADATPVAADLPRYDGDRVSGRHGGWNVLSAGGSVRFVTTANAGLNGDDIFRNGDGWHRAGLHADDISLGRPFDRP